MGKTWMKLKPEETTKKVVIIEDGVKYKQQKNERCFFCNDTNCELVGYYGTYNVFGYFKGVCNECLEKLNKLKEKGTIWEEEYNES